MIDAKTSALSTPRVWRVGVSITPRPSLKTNDADRLLVDGGQHMRAVGTQNHLQRWEGSAKQIND